MSAAQRIVRWGILSTANIATKVAKGIGRAKDSQVAAVASRSLDRAKDWATKHEVPKAYGSYAELLADGQIDAIYIPLPNSMHCEWTIRAAEAGKHVLCEKPLGANVAESLQMADACKQHGRQLMDGVMWVHHKRADVMRAHLTRGELGEIKRITSAFSFRWDEVPADNIRVKPELAGGALGDLGWYTIRASLWAMGELPHRVFADARYFNDVEFNLSALLWFSGDRMGSFDCGFDTIMRQWLEVAGTKGSLVCDDFVVPVKEEYSRYWIHDGTGESKQHVVERWVQEVQMIEDFNAIIRSGKLDDRWPTEAINTQRVVDAVAASARAKQPVDVR